MFKKVSIYNSATKDIYDLSHNYNINLTSEIILNKNESILTFYNKDSYILFEIKINYYKEITLNDIYNFNVPINVNNYKSLDMTNWEKLWEMKVDYIESQIELLDKKFPFFCLISNYYIGLSENAIKLKKYINSIDDLIHLSVSHRRIKFNDNLFELYNPLNYIVDYRIRDISEFFKSLYFGGQDINYLLIVHYIQYNNITFKESLLLFDRLLYPSYFYDLYEEFISEKSNEQDMIIKYFELSKKYELELKNVYLFIEKFYNKKIPNLFWLLKKEA